MSRSIDRERSQPEKGRARRAPESPASQDERARLEALQRAVGNAGMTNLIDRSTTGAIESALGGGRPLREVAPVPEVGGAEHSHQGRATSGDADVRLHDDTTAANLSRSLGAVAFTFGRDIFLAADAPSLDTPAGKEVLRHELTHVHQQQGAAPATPKRVSSPDSPAERQASAAATAGSSPTAGLAPSGEVHGQDVEEEEELQLMRADTVQRQDVEEEEELQLLRADTVQRQEVEEEEELQLLRADTVQRQEAEDTPTNPALGVMFDVAVLDRVRSASDSLVADTPNPRVAFDALAEAVRALTPLADVYETSDRELSLELSSYRGALNTIREALAPLVGATRTVEGVQPFMPEAVARAQALRGRLH